MKKGEFGDRNPTLYLPSSIKGGYAFIGVDFSSIFKSSSGAG